MSDRLSQVFHALSDPTRRAILERLVEGDLPVGEVARPFAMSLPAVSKHLSVLERAGLVRREIDGHWRRCRLEPEPLKEALGWIERYRVFWEESFDRLATLIEKEDT